MRHAIKKYKILLVVELFILLILLPGCFRKEQLVYSVSGVTVDAAEAGVFQSVNFSLNPGVYQVRVHAPALTDGYIYVSAGCEESSFRALRSNGATLFANQADLDFEVYVLDEIDSAYVTLSFGNGAAAEAESLEVYRTNLGTRMLIFVLTVCCMGLDFLLFFREGIISGKVRKEQQVVFWGLSLSVLLAYFPYMTDYFSGGADIMFHWLRMEGLKETLMQGGQFPVRIQSYWLYDHGYAVSSFYGDLFLIIPVLFRFLGFSLMSAYKMFVFTVMAATAGIAYYSFKKCTGHTYAALFGSVIYVLAPYRIYNFYNRGAVGEYLAMVFLPLVICGMYRLYTEDINDKSYSRAKIPLIIGLSGILQSHLLTCEMTAVFIVIICIVFFKRTFRKKTFMQLAQAAVLCLLVNAWFWLPLLQMMTNDKYFLSNIISHDIQYMGTLFAEVFQLYPNMGGYQEGMYNAEPFQMGIASLLMLIVMTVVQLGKLAMKKDTSCRNPYDKVVRFWCVLILITWFMSTKYFPWDGIAQIPGVGFLATSLQFPTRLFSPISALSGIAAAFFFVWFGYECKERIQDQVVGIKIKTGVLFLLTILTVGSAVYHVNDIAIQSGPIWLHNAENMGTVSVINGEYLLEGTVLGEYQHHDPAAEEGLEWSDYHKKGTTIQMYVKNNTDKELSLELPLTGYKGYAVDSISAGENTVDEQPYIAEERGQHGDLKIVVPGFFEGAIRVCYKGFASYRIAEMISLLTLLGFALLMINKRKAVIKGGCNGK